MSGMTTADPLGAQSDAHENPMLLDGLLRVLRTRGIVPARARPVRRDGQLVEPNQQDRQLLHLEQAPSSRAFRAGAVERRDGPCPPRPRPARPASPLLSVALSDDGWPLATEASSDSCSESRKAPLRSASSPIDLRICQYPAEAAEGRADTTTFSPSRNGVERRASRSRRFTRFRTVALPTRRPTASPNRVSTSWDLATPITNSASLRRVPCVFVYSKSARRCKRRCACMVLGEAGKARLPGRPRSLDPSTSPSMNSGRRVEQRKHGNRGSSEHYTVSLYRPRWRRRLSTLRPPRVRIRPLNPCTRARRRFFGWYVRTGMIDQCPRNVSIIAEDPFAGTRVYLTGFSHATYNRIRRWDTVNPRVSIQSEGHSLGNSFQRRK